VRIFLSTATLIIVPDVALIEHWVGQIGLHVNSSSSGGGGGGGGGGNGDFNFSGNNNGNNNGDDNGDDNNTNTGDYRAPPPPLRVLAVGGMSEQEAAHLTAVHGGGALHWSETRGPGRKPGASSYTLTRLSLSLTLVRDVHINSA